MNALYVASPSGGPNGSDKRASGESRLWRWLRPAKAGATYLVMAALLGGLAPAQDEKIVLVPVDREKPVPLFFSAQADTVIKAGIDKVEETITAKLRVHQGRPEVLSLGLTGVGEITGVTGAGLKTWTVRREA